VLVELVMPRLALVVALVLLLPAAASAAWTTALDRFDRIGISFTYSNDWYVTTRPLSNGADPDYRFAVATWPVRRTRRDEGPCLAGIAKQRPPGGALAFLREYVGASRKRALPRLPRRPRRFRLPSERDGDWACLGKRSVAYQFQESGRALVLAISVGPRATAETRLALGRILASLHIRRRP